jgi:hypothetical protein
MQATLAVISAACGGLAAWQSGNWLWVGGAILIFANWPFTLLVIMPTNLKLYAVANEDAGPRERALIQSWGRLHAVRTCLSALAMFVFAMALS